VNRSTRAMTKSYVHLEELAECPFSVAQEYATDYLRRAETETVVHVPLDGTGNFSPAAKTVRFSFGVRSDTDERGRSHDELSVQWAARTPLLPHLSGTLRFRIAGNRTRLVLDGSYVPPGAALGRIFDAVLGHWVAVKTCRDLLRRIARELTERERAWRSEPT
jgi:hypothetical protein